MILEHDWNTGARTSSVRSPSDKYSSSRLFIEQISPTNREQSNCTSNRRLFCKYPSSASRSKMLRKLSSGGSSILNDLYKFISQSCDKFSLEAIVKQRSGSCTAILISMRLQRALRGFKLRARHVCSSYHSHGRRCSQSNVVHRLSYLYLSMLADSPDF